MNNELKRLGRLPKTEQDDILNEMTRQEKMRVEKMLKIIALAEKGLTNRRIVDTLGIGKCIIETWIDKADKAIDYCEENYLYHDEHEDFLYIEFSKAFKQGRAIYQQGLLDNIKAQAEGEFGVNEDGNRYLINKPDWKAAKWLLEKADAEEYGDKQEININHKGDGVAGGASGAIVIPVLGNTVSEEDMNKMLADSQSSLLKEIESKKDKK